MYLYRHASPGETLFIKFWMTAVYWQINIITLILYKKCQWRFNSVKQKKVEKLVMKSDSKRQVMVKGPTNVQEAEWSLPYFICVWLWTHHKPDSCIRPLYNTVQQCQQDVFISIPTAGSYSNPRQYAAIWSPDPFILQNLWPSNRLHRDVWIAGNICPHNSPVPGSKAGKSLIFFHQSVSHW